MHMGFLFGMLNQLLLDPAAALLVAVLAVAMGWYLPLLGISLVGFLVADVLIAAVKVRRSAWT